MTIHSSQRARGEPVPALTIMRRSMNITFDMLGMLLTGLGLGFAGCLILQVAGYAPLPVLGG